MKEPIETIDVCVATFRRTLSLFIWWDREYYEWIWLWDLVETMEWAEWCYCYVPENNCNVIWLNNYDLVVLVHELIHCWEQMCKQCWVPTEWEPIAYIIEELLTKILTETKWKFKFNKKK